MRVSCVEVLAVQMEKLRFYPPKFCLNFKQYAHSLIKTESLFYDNNIFDLLGKSHYFRNYAL